jgi:hypothetical protein
LKHKIHFHTHCAFIHVEALQSYWRNTENEQISTNTKTSTISNDVKDMHSDHWELYAPTVAWKFLVGKLFTTRMREDKVTALERGLTKESSTLIHFFYHNCIQQIT